MGIDQEQPVRDKVDEICTEVSRTIYAFFSENANDNTRELLHLKLDLQKTSGNLNKFVKALSKHSKRILVDMFIEQLIEEYTTEEQRKAFIKQVCMIVLDSLLPAYNIEGRLYRILNEKYDTEEYRNIFLRLSAEQGNLNAVIFFVEKGGNISSQDEMGYTPLHLAARHGNLDVVKYLVEKGADVDAYQGGYSYSTVLHLAAENGHLDTVKYLIEKGANPNATDSGSKTPMQRAKENGHSDIVAYLATRTRQVTEVPEITERQQTTEKLPVLNKDGDTALHLAAIKDDLNSVKNFVERGVYIDVRNKHGATALHIASIRGNLEMAQFLLDHGADVNARVTNDFTPLNWAVVHGHLAMVKLLLDHCADVNIQESESYAEHNFGYGRTPLISAVIACNTEIAKVLLDNGADVSIKGRGLTALDFANTKKDECPEMLVLLKEGNIKKSDSRSHCSSFMAASRATKPSLFISNMLNSIGASTIAALSGIFKGTPALPFAQQSISYSGENSISSSQVSFGEIAFLADVSIRKFTGQKYSRSLNDSLLTLEQIKEKRLSAIEGDVKMAISKFEKLDWCPKSSLRNIMISKEGDYQKSF